MWMAEIIERSIKSAMADLDVVFRASRIDDEPTSKIEHKEYPSMVILSDSGSKNGNTDLYYNVPVTVMIVTLAVGDEKKTTLVGLEDEFRTILDSGIYNEFTAVAEAAGASWYYKGIIDIEGTPPQITDKKEQVITFTMTFKICGSPTA